jgi:hypothetical protein
MKVVRRVRQASRREVEIGRVVPDQPRKLVVQSLVEVTVDEILDNKLMYHMV